MQVGVYLNIYVTPFVMVLLKRHVRAAVWPGEPSGRRFGNKTVCFQHFSVPIYLYFSTYCFRRAVNQYRKCGQTSQSRHMGTDTDFSAKRKNKKKQLRSQVFLIIVVVITFMPIIIRVQRAHSQNSYLIYLIVN